MASGVAGDTSFRDWANLSSLPVSVIPDHLPPLDRCRFRAVCRAWKEEVPQQSVYRPYLESYDSYVDQTHAPSLILTTRYGTGSRFYFKVSSPSLSLFRINHLPSMGVIVGTSPGGGILHVQDRTKLSAINLFTLEELHAPPIAKPVYFSYFNNARYTRFIQKYGSSPCHEAIIYFPMPSGESRRYAFILLTHVYRKMWFAWEGDKSWTEADVYPRCDHSFHHILPHDGVIYGINPRVVGSLDLSGAGVRMLSTPFLDKSNSPVDYSRGCCNFLAEISGELWALFRIESFLPPRKRSVDGVFLSCTLKNMDVVMYRLDKRANVWRKESNFEAGIAFVPRSLVLRNCDFPHLQPVCIYFTDGSFLKHDEHVNCGIVIYNVKGKTWKTIPSLCVALGSNMYHSAWMLHSSSFKSIN